LTVYLSSYQQLKQIEKGGNAQIKKFQGGKGLEINIDEPT